MENKILICPDCRANMRLSTGRFGYFYSCCNYPRCTTTHRADASGNPVGTPADKHTRHVRQLLRVEIDRMCKRHVRQIPEKMKQKYKALCFTFLGQTLPWTDRTRMCRPENFSFDECMNALVKLKGMNTHDLLKWAGKEGYWATLEHKTTRSIPKYPGLFFPYIQKDAH